MPEPGSASKAYSETLEFLYRKLPMFSRTGSAAIKKGLDNIDALCHFLGQPQDAFRSIHIAGTNGKGSVAHMLAAIGAAAGLKTGLCTSPHYVTFRERIRINGEYISENKVIEYVQELMPAIEKLQPSFFEISVAMALMHFAREGVDWAVIETGLGGRLDSTNIIHPAISVITNISLEHTDMLGNTLALIAAEKAGIIKNSVPVIIGADHPETRPVFSAAAMNQSAPLTEARKSWNLEFCGSTEGFRKYLAQDMKVPGAEPLAIQLQASGVYQDENLRTVLATWSEWQKIEPELHQGHLMYGLKHLVKLSRFQGRWQVLPGRPVIVLDSAHNAGGMELLIQNLQQHRYNRLHIILGMVADKDHDQVLVRLPKDASYYFTEPSVPRKWPAASLAGVAGRHQLNGSVFQNLTSALDAATAHADTDDMILVTGSCFLVADALQCLNPTKSAEAT